MGRHAKAPNAADEAAAGQIQIALGAADRGDYEAAKTALEEAWRYYSTLPETSAARTYFAAQAANVFTSLGLLDTAGALIERGVQPVQGVTRRHAISGRYSY